MKLLNNRKVLLTITVTLFFISVILGLALFSLITPANPEGTEVVKYYKYDSSWETFLSILSKNAMVCIGLASGIYYGRSNFNTSFNVKNFRYIDDAWNF
ncbi:hypothetical protein [Bacillus cereus]|uniref:hypothetical protein n=1 Tax=Bacillus cereus TaxID=1396 RepID=UPI0003A78DEA|nr:hypothetical protein [Bacillus cereus]